MTSIVLLHVLWSCFIAWIIYILLRLSIIKILEYIYCVYNSRTTFSPFILGAHSVEAAWAFRNVTFILSTQMSILCIANISGIELRLLLCYPISFQIQLVDKVTSYYLTMFLSSFHVASPSLFT